MKINNDTIEKFTPAVVDALGDKAPCNFRWIDSTGKVFMVSVKDKHALMTDREVLKTVSGRWCNKLREELFNEYSFIVNVPLDAEHPQWESDYPENDWKEHVDPHLREMWNDFSLEQKRVISGNLREVAMTLGEYIQDEKDAA